MSPTRRSPKRRRALRLPAADIPDVRDGLTRLERAILVELAKTQEEKPGRGVSTAMLYGRVLDLVDVSQEEFLAALTRLVDRAKREK